MAREAASVESRIAPGSIRAWILACRPTTLTAAIAPVAVGTAVAYASGGARLGPALVALVGALLIQIATNFANDVFDHEKGADTAARLGPIRATQSGLLTPRQVRAGMLAAVLLAIPVGLYLAALAGPPIVLVGAVSIVSGIAYTAGPWPLGYHGLGDLFVFVFFGLVAVAGTTFVQTGSVPTLAWLAGAALGAMATAVLVVNNVRDRATDAVAGKRTLAVRLGRRGACAEYVALLAVAYGLAPIMAIRVGSAWPILPIVSAPFGALLARRLVVTEGRALNACLAGTAKLVLAYGVLLATGLVLATTELLPGG